MKCRAQATIELLLLLGISLIALAIIYSLYLQQVELSGASREAVTTKNTLDNLVNAANRLYISGPGSKTRVFVDLPNSLNMSAAEINASSLSLQLSSGTDLVTTADVNFVGDWKKANGEYLTGGYYASLVFDGNVVRIYYDDYDLSSDVIFVAAKQGASVTKTFSVRNNSQNNAHFWINNYFSHSPNVSLTIDNSDFVLTPNETKLITLDFVLSTGSSGNYSGYLTVIGQINDGASDLNNSKQVLLSVESFSEIKEVMINPNSTSLSGLTGSSHTKSFSVCNSGYYDLSSLSWAKEGDASSWFSLPSSIISVSKGTCADFDLIITIPSNASLGVNDANFTVFFNDGNSFTSYIYITVLSSHAYSAFFSGTDNNLTHWFDFNGFVKKRADNNSWIATGELDWNSSLIVSSSASDSPISSSSPFWDANLVAVYHLDGNLVDSKNANHLTGANSPSAVTGLWNTQAYSVNGSNQRLYLGYQSVSWDITANPTNSYSFGGWIKPRTCTDLAGVSLTDTNAWIRLTAYSGGWLLQNIPGYSYTTGGSCVIGQWQHIIGTYERDTNRLSIYQNGIRVATAIATSTGTNTGAARDGIMIGSAQNYFNGDFEEVLVFDKTLSEAEVLSLYLSQKARYVDENLAAYLKLDYLTSTATIDSAQNRAVGLYNSPTTVSGFWDSNALFFDGTNDHLAINADQNLKYTGGDMTISLWIKQFDDADGGYFVSKPWNAVGVYNYYLLSSSTGIITAGVTGATSGAFATTSAMPLGVWNHLVAVFGSDKSVNIYVNGVLFKSGSHGITSWAPSGGDTNINLAVGCIYPYGSWAGSTSLCLKSQIDELKIYKKAFTVAEVMTDYNSWIGSKFVDANIVNAGRTVDWNQLRVNKSALFDFGKGIEDWNKLKAKGANALGESIDVNYLFTDSNLVGLWHGNDMNSQRWALNSKTNLRDASLLTSADVNIAGLFDSNAFNLAGGMISVTNTGYRIFSDLNGAFTISGWISPSVIGSATSQTILSSNETYGAGGSGYRFGFQAYDPLAPSLLRFWSTQSGGTLTLNSTTKLALNQWTHFAVVYNGANLGGSIYINGVAEYSVSTGVVKSSTNTIYFGGGAGGTGYFFGKLDELGIWNRSLSSAEVKSLYYSQSGKFAFNNNVGLWHFDNTLNDSSSSSYNLTNSGIDYASGLWGANSANFDGTDYAFVADNSVLDNNNNSFTWNFWAKHTTTALQRIFSKFYYTGDNSGYGAFFNWPTAGNFTFCIYSNNSNCNNSVSTTGYGKVNDGYWHMNTAVVDRTTNLIYIYIDGILAGSGSISGIAGLNTSDDLYVGKHRTLDNNYTGLMDELSLWNRALNANEVRDLYRKGVSRLDLNIYSCSDVLCANKTSSAYVSDVNNGLWTSLPSSLLNSRYLGVDAIFGKSSVFNDYNAGTFWVGSFFSDFNVEYLG